MRALLVNPGTSNPNYSSHRLSFLASRMGSSNRLHLPIATATPIDQENIMTKVTEIAKRLLATNGIDPDSFIIAEPERYERICDIARMRLHIRDGQTESEEIETLVESMYPC